jgi:type II secretory pathway component PulJ
MFITTNKGFTLVETIVAITLGVMISIAAISLFVSGLKEIQEAKELSYLQSNATFLTNTFDYWIKQAEEIELVNSSSIRIITPGDDKLIALDGNNNITMNGFTLNDERVEVSSLNFNKLESSVQIGFTLKDKNSSDELFLETAIAKRNNYAN